MDGIFLGALTQAQYDDWIQRVQPRLDALALQSRLLAEQFESLQKIASALQADVERALQTVLAAGKK